MATARDVLQILQSHYEKTGRIMSSQEMILAAGEPEPAILMSGMRLFNRYLTNKRSGVA